MGSMAGWVDHFFGSKSLALRSPYFISPLIDICLIFVCFWVLTAKANGCNLYLCIKRMICIKPQYTGGGKIEDVQH